MVPELLVGRVVKLRVGTAASQQLGDRGSTSVTATPRPAASLAATTTTTATTCSRSSTLALASLARVRVLAGISCVAQAHVGFIGTITSLVELQGRGCGAVIKLGVVRQRFP